MDTCPLCLYENTYPLIIIEIDAMMAANVMIGIVDISISADNLVNEFLMYILTDMFRTICNRFEVSKSPLVCSLLYVP